MPVQSPYSSTGKPYRFGFILSTAIGNQTRYLIFRKYAERDPEVEFVWAPVKHYIAPNEPNPLRWIPEPFYTRAVILHQAKPVFGQMERFDAVMIHQFEMYLLASLRSLFSRHPLIVSAEDRVPITDPAKFPLYPEDVNRSPWRQKLRFWIDSWCVKRTPLFILYSKWARDIVVNDCGMPPGIVHYGHVGLDLEEWHPIPINPDSTSKPKILFIGGDFIRKGGDLLLQVFGEQFADQAELHLLTGEPLTNLPPNVYVHSGITPGSDGLKQLYGNSDLFVLPTTADLTPWSCLEAMAIGRPVISTTLGSIPELVQHGETGLLIPPNDKAALIGALRTLIENPAERLRMGNNGRMKAERDFNASVNVPRILNLMKEAVDQRRSLRSQTLRLSKVTD